MKELSIEEKAKRYDEAIERARKCLDEKRDTCFVRPDVIFPELAESEDEKIRKGIIKELVQLIDNIKIITNETSVHRHRLYQYIEWLEKQGEQKPVEPQQDMLSQEKYAKAVDECIYGEQKPADKVEPKFKVGDIIKPKDGGHEPWQIMQVDISDKKYRFADGYVIHFSQEEDYELVEQKPAWSEEDEETLKDIITSMTNLKDSATSDALRDIYNSKIDWLKSLKERYTWKPSEKQMKVVLDISEWSSISPLITEAMKSLYEDLKKLRKE